MQTTSQTWKDLWASGAARLEARATIAGAEYTDFPKPPVITRAAMQGGLSVGNVASAMCAIALRSGASIPKSAGVRVDMRLTDGDTVSEWLPAGTFFISRRARDPLTGVLALECYDALLKANAVWTPSEGDWPRSAAEVVTELAALLGVEIDSRTALAGGCVVREPAAGTTIRQVLGQIAQYCGGNWVLTPANRLRLVPLDNAGDGAEVAAVLGQIDAGEAGEITGVRCDVDGTRTISGDDSGVVIDVDLAPVEATDLAERLVGTACRPFALQRAVYDPAAELGDGLTYGGTALGTLWSETATLGPAFRGDVAAPTPAELADEYPYIGGAGKTLALAKAYADRAVDALDDDLTQQEIFNRLTGDGAAQGLVLVNGQLYMNASYIHSGTLTLGGLNNQSGILRLLDAAGGELGRMDNKGLEITNGVIASYAEDRQSRVMLYDGSFGYQEWGTGADGLDGWQDRLVLDGDNGTPTIFGYTGLLIRSKEGTITIRNQYPPYLTGGIFEMDHGTGKITLRAKTDTGYGGTIMTIYDGVSIDTDLKVTDSVSAGTFYGPLTGNVTGHASSDLALSGGTLTGDLFFSNSGTTTRQIRGIAGDNDYWRIAGGATAANAGWMEIATADDGNEPIYVRQYTGAYATVARTLTLLDGSGNTSIPGQLQFPGRGTNYLSIGPNDAANGVGGALNNLVFSSWYGVSFTTSCTGQTYTGKNAVSINCRNGNVYAARFNGPLTGNVTGNCSGSSGSCTGNAANVTGTVAIGHGGTGGTSVAAATNNLGLTYAANNTDSYESWGASGVLMNSSKTVRVHFYTSKSMANISTVTVTRLNVVIRGVKGALNSSTSYTNYVGASGYTVTATKRNNYLIQLELVKSSAFTNNLDNSPVYMVGTVNLKFT